jgi:uncharacterized protein involved in exopolysaccharide biosynthesis
MRVYGSSPLYNYVELVFRSKRLFIASILIATCATVAIAAARSGSYNAQALVYLTGSDTASPTVESSAQKGSIQYKVNLLNVSTKDPEFIKAAFREQGLNRGMTDEQFNDFCKKAKSSLSFATGNNVLEISCRWPDNRAADIIKAFYSAFARRVLDEETVTSHIAKDAIAKRLDEYTQKQQEIENKVIAFKKSKINDMPESFETTVQKLYAMRDRVQAMENALSNGRLQLAEIERQLSGTKPTIVDVSEYKTDTAMLDKLKETEAALDAQLAELRTKYTDSNPQIRKLLEQRENLEKAVKQQEAKSGTPNKSRSRYREVPNPLYQNLERAKGELETQIQVAEGQLADGRKMLVTLEQKAKDAPEVLQKYEWMTKDLRLYTEIRDNLRAKLEQAEMVEKQEREMHLAEMKMIVEPESELEVVSGKNLIFYAAGPLLGLIIAFAFSLLTETLDHSLRTPIEVEKYLGKPVLAVLPRMDAPKDSAQRRLGGGSEGSRPTLPT